MRINGACAGDVSCVQYKRVFTINEVTITRVYCMCKCKASSFKVQRSQVKLLADKFTYMPRARPQCFVLCMYYMCACV